jgi:hypothetical protein
MTLSTDTGQLRYGRGMRTPTLGRPLLALALAGIAAVGLATDAPGRARRTRPVVLELEGYVERAPDGTPLVATLTLGHGKRTRPFAVKKLSVPTQPPSPSQVLAAVRPYPTNFMLRGSDATLAPFDHATPGTGLVIRGHWPAGTFDLLVDRIAPLETEKK